MEKQRNNLLRIYQTALDAVNGRHCVRNWLNNHPLEQDLHVVAIGKAAASMYQGASDAVGDSIRTGLLITRHGYADNRICYGPHEECIEAGHPLPDEYSLQAGDRLLKFIHNTPATGQLLFLISGGTSSLVEVLPEGVTLEDLHRVNEWLLGSGLKITDMNILRKRLSSIKGGRLANFLGRRHVRVLIISDVKDDDIHTIGSGLLVPDEKPDEQSANLSQLPLPDWIGDMLARTDSGIDTDDAGKSGVFDRITIRVIASLADARLAAARQARELGYTVKLHDGFIEGEASAAGRTLAQEIIHGNAGLHVWGGETTVSLPESPGRGGRCQHMALAVAAQIKNRPGLYFLAAGTDGSDGSDDAGALVDDGSIERGELDDLDANQCLATADSGAFLQASGDLIHTGPTGTNVMDILLGLKI
ncbi:MAG: glycerate kinase [Gammaproteobacteria bacterium]|nr:MAG: glycerate kinase [Gammaproteobacteria bacterium]